MQVTVTTSQSEIRLPAIPCGGVQVRSVEPVIVSGLLSGSVMLEAHEVLEAQWSYEEGGWQCVPEGTLAGSFPDSSQ